MCEFLRQSLASLKLGGTLHNAAPPDEKPLSSRVSVGGAKTPSFELKPVSTTADIPQDGDCDFNGGSVVEEDIDMDPAPEPWEAKTRQSQTSTTLLAESLPRFSSPTLPESGVNKKILGDIVILPRSGTLRRSASQPPSSFYDVEVKSDTPFLPPGIHRVWNAPSEQPAEPLPSRPKNAVSTSAMQVALPRKSKSRRSIRITDRSIYPPMKVERRRSRLGNSDKFLQFFATFPRIANAYLLLGFNFSIATIVIVGLWAFASSLRQDVMDKILVDTSELSIRALQCREDYERNRCHPDFRVPALEQMCNDWFQCMTVNGGLNGASRRAVLSAETFGQVINTFLDQLTWKSIILLVIGLCALLISTNLFLLVARYCWVTTEPSFKSAPGAVSNTEIRVNDKQKALLM